MGKYYKIFIIIIVLSISSQATINKVDDLFGDLYKGDIYSGYLNTTIIGNELFYIYTPSQNDPDTAPVLLWLNGGPGCSSLFGFLGEVGPVVEDDFAGGFKTNPYSWNTNANLLAIEQPAGVGFSPTSDVNFTWTDDVTAENLLAAVKDFLEAFNLTDRPFHISGESYAGVYIPFLATHMLEDPSTDKVNLAGVLIGNGLTDFDTDVERSMVHFAFYHGLIPIELYNSFKRHCLALPDELTPEENEEGRESNDGFYPRYVTHKCNEIRTEIKKCYNGIDMYGIYRICPPESRFSINENSPLYLNRQFTMKKTIIQKLKEYRNQNSEYKEILFGLEPENDIFPKQCGDDLVFDNFLNDPVVKKKLAVYNESLVWTQCYNIKYNMSDSYIFYNETMLKYPDVKVWVYSGTEDGVLPTLGTMRWINKLGYTVETKWKQWKVEDQVAGFVQKYEEGLVIVTVKGAGHMVPQDQRASAYNMVTAFLNGDLP